MISFHRRIPSSWVFFCVCSATTTRPESGLHELIGAQRRVNQMQPSLSWRKILQESSAFETMVCMWDLGVFVKRMFEVKSWALTFNWTLSSAQWRRAAPTTTGRGEDVCSSASLGGLNCSYVDHCNGSVCVGCPHISEEAERGAELKPVEPPPPLHQAG